MLAVIRTGGKQYLVAEDQELKIEKTDFDAKKNEVVFEDVLLVSDDKKTEIGQPTIKSAKVTATVLGEIKEKKVLIVKHHPKKHYRRTQGHRQQKLKIKITKIEA